MGRPAFGQTVPASLRYELTDAVLARVRPMALLPPARPGPGGQLVQPPAQLLPVLLLDRPDSAWVASQLGRVLDALASPAPAQRRNRFTPADLTYMRQQLARSARQRLAPHRLRQPGVVLVSADTVTALYRRGGARRRQQYGVEQYDYTVGDSLQRRFGSLQLFQISGPLFSSDHRRAVLTVAVDDGWQTFVYRKMGATWREDEALEAGVSCH
ncbi:hypothetical protein EJV47_13870 [Hymenobacter gummosus]|uniref:Uncharacterized protein n=1 Tax=Hymenobacter gummosus TaxID=1776032 RepID=A0A3S0IMW2_9BACT|nr:hypothetical protein [Hymenobacter gummosus]RTQ49229.1 hypothetical protein EJV47_13870 [Hymenobacter gummosus]